MKKVDKENEREERGMATISEGGRGDVQGGGGSRGGGYRGIYSPHTNVEVC